MPSTSGRSHRATWNYQACNGGGPLALAIEIYHQYFLAAGCFDTTRTQLRFVIEGLEKSDLWPEADESLLQRRSGTKGWPEIEIGHELLEDEETLHKTLRDFKMASRRLVMHIRTEAKHGSAERRHVARNLVQMLAAQIRIVEMLVDTTGESAKESRDDTSEDLHRIWGEKTAS